MQHFFSYYIRQQMILADVTVGCQSNGRRVSSISDILAPAAKAAPAGPPTPASRGRLCCRGGLTAPTIPTAGQALRRRQPHTAAEPVNPRTPLRAGFHCRVFPGSASSPSQASPSSTALVLSARRGQRGQGTTSIGRVLYVERLTAGSTAAARK